MKPSFQKKSAPKQKPRALKKSSTASAKNKGQKAPSQQKSQTKKQSHIKKKSLHKARGRLEKQVADLGKARNLLKETVEQQADELKTKNGLIRIWEDKERLAEEQVLIRTKAMDSTSDGIFIIDAQKGGFPILYSNRSFQKMTDYEEKDILGKNYFLFYGAMADPRIAEEIKKTLRQDNFFHGEMLNFKKNGKKFWNYMRITSVRDAAGTVTHYIGIQTDVTLKRERDLEFKEQREELLHVTRVGKLAEFVSSLAHEISQPLTAILSYAQAAHRMLEQREPEIREILDHIVSDDQRASEVIRRLRSLLKKSDPEFELLDMNILINETVALIETDVTVRNKFIKTELNAKLPLIIGDRVQLQQVLLNLISNSLEAMEVSEKSRELVVRTFCKDSGSIMVEVEDSGCGIPAQNMKKLFHHFFTSKPDGLGMGLSISRSIIEAHGGRLDVENNSGSGATFYFILPIGKKDSS